MNGAFFNFTLPPCAVQLHPTFSLSTFFYKQVSANAVMEGNPLHLGLDVLEQSLELVHVGLLLGPLDAETLGLVGLGDLGEVSWGPRL
jgi:hypothetical protein